VTDSYKRSVVYSTRHFSEIEDHPITDIDRDPLFLEVFNAAREYTMTSKEVMFSLYQAVRFVADRQIMGDFVECGVWRGGSSLLAALSFRQLEKLRAGSICLQHPRQFWLYDTFEGMTQPTSVDVDIGGHTAQDYIDQFGDEGHWCYADLDDVRRTFTAYGFDDNELRLVKGDVIDTLKKTLPERIAILRLDTDWYESTKLELEVLYPRLVRGGVLIIDDYGHWEGSRQAVDEYFAKHPPLLLQRVSYAVRMGIKV
jgi:O-methyltransferase